MKSRWTLLVACLTLVHGAPGPAAAKSADTGQNAGVVPYPATFFEAYRPVSARDMVDQVPGFRIDDGGGTRGFGGAAGNVLIDGERPSTKQDSVSQILERIPAARVVRIELIRGNTGRFDSGNQSVLVNVITNAQVRSWTWEATIEQDPDSGGPTPGASVSVVDRNGNTEWGAGLRLSTSFFGNDADEDLIIDGRVVEDRDEFERNREHSIRVNANSVTRLDRVVLRFNGEAGFEDGDFRERSRRTPRIDGQPAPAAAFNLDRRGDEDELEYELGTDIEWTPGSAWTAKLIGLRRREHERGVDQELLGPTSAEADLRQEAATETIETESIGRIELDWSGLDRHLLELNLEAALNSLDNELDLFAVQSGTGLVAIEVPGANNRVEELRGDMELRDTWEIGPKLSLESALGAEASEISQSGAGTRDRMFFFFKPSVALTHSPNRRVINRLNLSREIAQLDFSDFVSSTNFGDNDVDRGNPDLEPQQTWLAELSTEKRFGDVGAARLSVFHRWVRDVQDRLPIGDEFEVPGNIGNGRRWGVEFEGTVPLTPLGLEQSRLDIESGWEDSSATDPVTGDDRRFSGQRRFAFESQFRQDLVGAGWAWGFETEYIDDSRVFELDEIDVDDRGFDLEAFVETTRYLGVKMQLTVQNLLDREFIRDRTVFDGPRGTSDVEFRELRDRRRGRSVLLSISGSF